MVKSVSRLDKTIFNYLGKENSAVLLAHTGFFADKELNDGVLWVQYNDENQIAAVFACDNDNCVAVIDENSDFDELKFMLHGKIISPSNLPFKQIDKNYLMHKRLDTVIGEKGIKYTKYGKISAINKALSNGQIEVRRFLNLCGNCEGCVIEEKLKLYSGGFISFNKELAVISDVFTKEKYRGQGYGKRLVNKLLKLSPVKDVYLLCRDYNTEFYEKLGFETAKEIYEYRIEE